MAAPYASSIFALPTPARPSTSRVSSTATQGDVVHPLARHLAAAAATLLAAGPAGAQTPAAQRPTVAVMHINNAALVRHGDYEHLGRGITDVLISELQDNPAIDVVEREHVLRIMQEQDFDTTGRVAEETAVRLGKILGAQYMLFGGFIVDGRGRMRLDIRAVNVETTRVAYAISKTGKADDLLELIHDLAGEINRGMQLPPLVARPARPATGPPAADSSRRLAMVLFSRGLFEQDRGNTQQAVVLYEAALARNPHHERARERLEQLKPKG